VIIANKEYLAADEETVPGKGPVLSQITLELELYSLSRLQ